MTLPDTGYMLGSALAHTSSATTWLLNATNYGAGAIYRARDTTPITHVGIAVVAHVGTPPIYRVSIQGVNGTNPDGNIKAGGAAYHNEALPAGDDTHNWIALDTPYTPAAAGELFAVVIDWPNAGGTSPDANNYTSVVGWTTDTGWSPEFPYVLMYVGSWVIRVSSAPAFSAKDENGLILGGYPAGWLGSRNVDTGQVNIRAASLWTPDRDVYVSGVYLVIDSAKYNFVLRDDTDSALFTIALDWTHGNSGNAKGVELAWGQYKLIGGTQYKFSIEGEDATDVNIYGATFNDMDSLASIMGPLYGGFYVQATSEWTIYDQLLGGVAYSNMIYPRISTEGKIKGLVLGSGSG